MESELCTPETEPYLPPTAEEESEGENTEFSNEEEELEEEEDIYTRGRSRSRSVHANDDLADSSIVTPIDPSSYISKGNSNDQRNEKLSSERTGPLQQREVVALKKGLEEMTQARNPNQVQEEEDERRAAVVEKQNRTTATSAATSIGVDPPMRRVKILMLGDSGVGKSSLINRWTLDTFSPTLVSTVGVDFKAKKVPLDGKTLNVQVWDTAGQEHFHKITQNYYKGCNGIMLIYDVSDKQTLDNVEYWVKKIKKHALDSVHVALIGNKTDLRTLNASNPVLAPLCCDTDAGRNVAQKFGVPYFETSAKEGGVKVDEAFQTVLRCIVTGESFVTTVSSSGGNKAKPKSLAQKLEKTKEQSIFSNFGKRDKKDNKSAAAAGGGGGGGSGSGDETASNDSVSSSSSTGSAQSSGGGKLDLEGRNGKDKDCTIS